MTEPFPATSPADTPPPGTYRLDPAQSKVRADGKGMLVIPVHGTFQLLSGEVTIAEDPAQSTVRATIDAASYSSGMAKRDEDVISPTLLDAKAYPEITFSGGGAQAAGTGWVVPGTVTAHGVSAPAELRIDDVRSADGTVRFHAVTELDRTQFGVTNKKAMVGRKVAVIIDAVAVPAGPAA